VLNFDPEINLTIDIRKKKLYLLMSHLDWNRSELLNMSVHLIYSLIQYMNYVVRIG